MTAAAFERVEQPTDDRTDPIGVLLAQRIAFATTATFVALVLLVGQWMTILGFAAGVALLLMVGSLWLLAQRRTDLVRIVATGAMHLFMVLIVGTFI